MAWLGGKRKTEFSWTPASQAVSESKIFEQEYHFLRYMFIITFTGKTQICILSRKRVPLMYLTRNFYLINLDIPYQRFPFLQGFEVGHFKAKSQVFFLYAFEKTLPWKKLKKCGSRKKLSQILPENSTYVSQVFL